MKHLLPLLTVLSAFSVNAADDTDHPWVMVDDFESTSSLSSWTSVDTKNDTQPFVENPQVTEVRKENNGNHYLIKKPAAEGVVGNRKALTSKPLPLAIPVGDVYTVYTRFQVEYFPNNHVFGLSNLDTAGIEEQGYNALEPSLRITDKAESNGYKNDGTLMVKLGKGYKKVVNFSKGQVAQPLNEGEWYHAWMVVNNQTIADGGQVYSVYLQGGEFAAQTPVYLNADFRMHREQPLTHVMMNCNTGPKKAPYGNGGVLYDDIFMSSGVNLTYPK